MEIEIRAARPADSSSLAVLRYEFRSEVGEPIEDEAAFVTRCRPWMTARLNEPDRWRCWLGERNGEIVGHLWLQVIEKVPNPVREPERHAYVTNMYVRERVRGRGVGTRLLTAGLDWCRARGDVDAVILWPTERSRSLYTRHGFTDRHDMMEMLL